MERRTPSGTTAIDAGNSGIRRRSGGHSLNADTHYSSTACLADASLLRVPHHLKAIPAIPEDDLPHARHADDHDTTLLPDPFRTGAETGDETGSSSARLPEGATCQLISTGSAGFADDPTPRVERPLPPLPPNASLDNEPETLDREATFTSIPLTPKLPDLTPSKSHGSTFRNPRASVFALFPRLPSPTFAAFRRKSVSKSAGSSHAHAGSLSRGSSPLSRTSNPHTGSTETTNFAAKPSKRLFSGTDAKGGTTPETSSSRNLSSIVYGDVYESLCVKKPLRFTRKFPLPPSMGFGVLPNSDAFDVLIMSEDGSSTGVKSVWSKWTGYKWCLLLSTMTVLSYAMLGLVCSILTWFGTLSQADVMWVADGDILISATLASTLLLLTSLVGLTGTLSNSRVILSFYALLLWPSFVSILIVGYSSYKREALSLDRKLNMAWSQLYSDLGRLLIQESLHCCGYYNPLHEATFSNACYPRTLLSGCKEKLFQFERASLGLCWQLAFGLVPLHVLNIVISLLCSNHVDNRFGKGLTPQAYRLTMEDVRANADAILSHYPDTKLPFKPSRTFSQKSDCEGVFLPGLKRYDDTFDDITAEGRRRD